MPAGPVWCVDELLAEQGFGGALDLGVVRADLDAAGLAAGAGVDLRLDDPLAAADLGGAIGGLLGAVGEAAARDRHAELREKLLGLILVNVHCLGPPWISSFASSGLAGSVEALMAAAVAMRFFAIFSEAASIILPSSEAAPLPWASASLSATRMRSARSTSFGGRREHLVGELDLRGMDRPLAFDAESGGALGAGRVACRIGEVAERAVDRTQAVGAAGDRHARQGEVPLVARDSRG